MRPPRLIGVFFVLSFVASAVAGPEPIGAHGSPEVGSVFRSSHGLSEVDGRIAGGGPDWRVEFGAGGFSFTPAFGTAAPRTWPLAVSLESVRRAGGPELVSRREAAPRLVLGAVEVERSDRLVERYEARLEGVMQTFVFTERPQGAGDLVVTLRIETDLDRPVVGDHSSGLAFRAEGFGDVTLSGVTGVDAAGRTTPGTLSFNGDTIEYSLPAAFLDRADYPVVLDPLFGTEFTVASGFDETSPDVAFDASTNRFLVVWARAFSSGDRDVRGQLVNTDGSFFGGLIAITSNTALTETHPRVANVNSSNHFVVTWCDQPGLLSGIIRARTILANTGAAGAAVTIGSSTSVNLSPDVGGEYQESSSQAVVVWQSLNAAFNFDILAARLGVAPDGTLTVGTPVVIATGFNDVLPSISNTGGPIGVYFIAWRRSFTGGVADEIRGAAIDRNVAFVDSFVAVTLSPAWESTPSVDGDGTNFLVAFEREATSGSGDKDVHAVRVYRTSAGGFAVAANEIGVDVGVLNSDSPDVAWQGGSTMVAFRQLDLTNKYRAMLATFDPLGGSSCEGYFQLSTNSENTQSIRIGAGEDVALLAFDAEPLGGGNGVLRGQRFLAKDGVHKSLGGQCSSLAYTSCARIGNGQFALRLTSAPPSKPTYLIVGTSAIAVPCGPCVLTVDPASGIFLAAGNTDANGGLNLVTGLANDPALIGLTFGIQWLTVDSNGGPCPSLNAYLSNGLLTTIQ